MSKYEKGDRLWFEITAVIEASGGKTLYKCSNGGYATDGQLDGCTRLDPDEKANADFDAGYGEGLNDAWEAARQIYSVNKGIENEAIFGDGITRLGHVMKKYTVSDAVAKVHEYFEKKQKEEIKVGDEIVYQKMTLVVTHTSDMYVMGLDKTGSMYCAPRDDAKKTGRHFREIAGVLELMREADDADN